MTQETTSTYTPDAQGVCQHCGVVALSHAASGRCLTFAELRTRLRVYVATGQWPPREDEDTPPGLRPGGLDDEALDPAVARQYGLWEVYDPDPCPWCGEVVCEGACTGAVLGDADEEEETP